MDQDPASQPAPVPTTPVSPAPAPGAAAAPAWTPDPAPAPVAQIGKPAVRRGPSARLLNIILAGALVLAVGGIAFAAGRMTAPAAATTTRGGVFGAGGQGNPYFAGRGQGGGGFGGFGGALGGGGVSIQGTVESVSATTLTLKLASGQTIQIALDPSTTYHSQTNATASDIVTGGTVKVQLNLTRGTGGGPNASPGTGFGGGATATDITVVP